MSPSKPNSRAPPWPTEYTSKLTRDPQPMTKILLMSRNLQALNLDTGTICATLANSLKDEVLVSESSTENLVASALPHSVSESSTENLVVSSSSINDEVLVSESSTETFVVTFLPHSKIRYWSLNNLDPTGCLSSRTTCRLYRWSLLKWTTPPVDAER